MKTAALTILCLLLALFAAPPASAGGTIDATQYVPVGQFSAWEMIDKAQWDADHAVKAEPQVISVTKVVVEDGAPQYNVRTKFFQNLSDPIFRFGVKGDTVYLYGMRIVSGAADFDFGDLTVPTIFFDPPVPIGNANTPLDATFAVTPVTSTIEVDIDLGPKSISGKVFVSGTVTARWNSVAPIETPLGSPGPLAELQLNGFFTYSSDDGDIDDAVSGYVTDKGVSAVMGPGIGFVQIDGQGGQQKIVNRAIVPGQLFSNPDDPDAFPVLPEGDLLSFSVSAPGIVTLHDALALVADGDPVVTDGQVTLSGLKLEQALGGAVVLSGEVAAGVDEPAPFLMVGKASLNKKTGGLKVALTGKTKKLPSFAKLLKFSVKQELAIAPGDGGFQLDVVWNAGKDPLTKELITGTLPIPVAPFFADTVSVEVDLPVDVPKLKKGYLTVNPASRALGAEGSVTLSSAGDIGVKTFPLTLRETAKVKEGLPTKRSYKLTQTATNVKLFNLAATSTGVEDYLVAKLNGKLLGVKIAPVVDDVPVGSQ